MLEIDSDCRPLRFQVFIDISGSRDLATVPRLSSAQVMSHCMCIADVLASFLAHQVFRMMDLIDKIISPDAMVVKSQAMARV